MTAGKQEIPPRSRAPQEASIPRVAANSKPTSRANRVGAGIGTPAFSAASGIDKEERWQMIAEAAYYRYQNRGCESGNAVDDWLAAEEEIDRLLDF